VLSAKGTLQPVPERSPYTWRDDGDLRHIQEGVSQLFTPQPPGGAVASLGERVRQVAAWFAPRFNALGKLCHPKALTASALFHAA
jgi:hypothetical protein